MCRWFCACACVHKGLTCYLFIYFCENSSQTLLVGVCCLLSLLLWHNADSVWVKSGREKSFWLWKDINYTPHMSAKLSREEWNFTSIHMAKKRKKGFLYASILRLFQLACRHNEQSRYNTSAVSYCFSTKNVFFFFRSSEPNLLRSLMSNFPPFPPLKISLKSHSPLRTCIRWEKSLPVWGFSSLIARSLMWIPWLGRPISKKWTLWQHCTEAHVLHCYLGLCGLAYVLDTSKKLKLHLVSCLFSVSKTEKVIFDLEQRKYLYLISQLKSTAGIWNTWLMFCYCNLTYFWMLKTCHRKKRFKSSVNMRHIWQ